MPIEPNDLKPLPTCVQQYLRNAGIIGKEPIKAVELRQKGLLSKAGKRWMYITAEQQVDVDKCEFVWKAKAGPVRAVDRFEGGKGSMVIKFLGLFTMGKTEGPEIDQGEILRFLAEGIWYPTVFLSEYISWKEIDDFKAEASISWTGGKTASLQFEFNEAGEVVSISGMRYRESDGRCTLEHWLIGQLESCDFHGIRIPYKAEVGWKIEGEYLPYYRMEITDIHFS